MDGILVTEPVGALDGVKHVPPPVVLVHVAESGVDAALGSNSVAPRGEQLGDASRVEAGLSQAEGSTQTGTAGTDDDRIVLVVLVAEQAGSIAVLTFTLRGWRDFKVWGSVFFFLGGGGGGKGEPSRWHIR